MVATNVTPSFHPWLSLPVKDGILILIVGEGGGEGEGEGDITEGVESDSVYDMNTSYTCMYVWVMDKCSVVLMGISLQLPVNHRRNPPGSVPVVKIPDPPPYLGHTQGSSSAW